MGGRRIPSTDVCTLTSNPFPTPLIFHQVLTTNFKPSLWALKIGNSPTPHSCIDNYKQYK